MSEPERMFEDRLERAKLDALKELAYGASHEINNPLANISARAQTLLRDERDPDRRRALEAIHHQALRAHEMISDLMLFARPPRLDLQQVDVAAMVKRLVLELHPECERRSIEVTFSVEGSIPEVTGDPVQLAVAAKALVANSIDAIGQHGRIELRLSASLGDQSAIYLTVQDNGPGISPQVRPHIFDPFYSGREAGRGLGFGLSKAWRIVTDHGGCIEVAPGADAGVAFTLQLPLGGVRS